MRVLHIEKATGVGGAERHLLDLLPGLNRRGVDVQICVLAAGHHERFVEALTARGVRNMATPAGPDVNPALVMRLVREIRAVRPDIVHTHLIHADLHGQIAARRVGLPTVSSVHGAHVYRRPVVRWIAPAWTRRPHGTIAISRHVADELRRLRLARPSRIRVVPYGLDLEGWSLSDAERRAARAGLSLEPDHVAVGIASRLIEGKGHATLLAAVRRALTRVPGLRLLVAGDGPLLESLEARAEALFEPGMVRFAGFVGDVRSFLGACDVVVVPTLPRLGEGFGLVALEAMAASLPVVATSVASLPEVVLDGQTGFLVSPSSVDELASRLAQLGGDPDLRRRMGRAGRDRAGAVFSLDRMVERTLAVYDEVAASAGRPARPRRWREGGWAG